MSLALRTAADVPDRGRYLDLQLPDYVGRVCLGELRQQENNRNLGLSAFRYLKIIGGKTAALFEAAYFAGAILSTDDRRAVQKYARLGRNVGMIFQLTDDCIDFELDAETAKKPVQSDFEQGVVTLPLIRALAEDPGFRERAARGEATREEAAERVRACGGLHYARLVSGRYYDRAARLLAELELPEGKRRRLGEILDRAYYGLKRPAVKV